MTLLELWRGGAWPSSVRTVRRSVKSDNERDLRRHLLLGNPFPGHNGGTAGAKSEEGEGNDRSVCPESPGLHAHYKDWDNGFLPREGTAIPKPNRSSDRGLQLALVKLERVVIADQHSAVNMPLLLAHTARQATRVEPG
jgi:hypothetical protein